MVPPVEPTIFTACHVPLAAVTVIWASGRSGLGSDVLDGDDGSLGCRRSALADPGV
jgi:hypothetical protein